MDDFNVSSLHESKNEWCARLVTLFTPVIFDGYKSILEEAVNLCRQNDEMNKYLMTFQNFISRIPKWNTTIIETEKKRIVQTCKCEFLEDLITCVHIIQLKILTIIRVGQKQKKIDIEIPKLEDFIHKVYINVARKLYKNVYLFEQDVMPLQAQKNNREIEVLIQEGIINTIRDNIPVESILKVYMDETIEEDVEITKEEIIEEEQNYEKPINKLPNDIKLSKENDYDLKHEANITNNEKLDTTPDFESAIIPYNQEISFNDKDFIKDGNNNELIIDAPKTIERLEEISEARNKKRKEEEEEEEDYEDKLIISDEPIDLSSLDVHEIDGPKKNDFPELLIDDVEVLS